MGRYSRSGSRSRSKGRDDAYDEEQDGYRVHIADLGVDCSQKELERHFTKFGESREIWLARNPPCFAFIVYKHRSDAEESIKEMDGRIVCNSRVRVSWARPRTRGRNARFDPNMRCYQCGERGHFSRDCNSRSGRNRYDGRHDDRRGRRRRSRSRSRSRSRRRDRRRSSHSRSRSRSRTPRRDRDRRDRSRSRSTSRDRRRRHRSRSNDRRKRSHSKSRSKSNDRKASRRTSKSRSRSRSRSRSASEKRAESPTKMEISQNGNGDVRNGHSKSRSRSRSQHSNKSPRRSDDGQSDHEESKEGKHHTNGDVYDPTKSDNENDESKADGASNGDNIVHADYQSDNEEVL